MLMQYIFKPKSVLPTNKFTNKLVVFYRVIGDIKFNILIFNIKLSQSISVDKAQ